MQRQWFSRWLAASILAFAGGLPGAGPATAGELDLNAGVPGEEPEGLAVIDGSFQLVEAPDAMRCIEVSPTPLTEAGALFGATIKGAGRVGASFIASRRGRSNPRFGVGLHGIAGHRLRVVPSAGRIELLFREELIATAPFEWTSGAPCHLELHLREHAAKDSRENPAWVVEAFAWQAQAPRPREALLAVEVEESSSPRGKASLWATPYAGLPIRITAASSDPGNPAGTSLNPPTDQSRP